MKKLSTLIALICISSIIHSCKKDFNSDIEEISTLSDTSWARVYYKKLIKEQGRKVTKTPNNSVASISSVKIENFKHTIWKKAYYSETHNSLFVEIPLLYNQRSSLIKTKGRVTEEEALEIFRTSFDRVIIYKDKKTNQIDQRIVTYIPELNYLRKHNKDISHNQINKLDKDFTGYLEYKKWDGTRLFRLELKNGKTIDKYMFPKEIKRDPKQIKVSMIYQCGVEFVPIFEEVVSQEYDPETQSNIWGVTANIVDYVEEPRICDDGLTGDPCIDYGLECGNNSPLTGDSCIDYGYCDPTPSPLPAGLQKDLLTNTCFSNVLNKFKLGSYGTAANVSSLGLILNLSFGLNKTWSIVFKDAQNVYNDNNVELEASAGAQYDVNDNSKVIVTVTLSVSKLSNSSQEYIAAALLHEIEHAYLRMIYPTSTESFQHESMAGEFMRNQMVDGIMGAFPNTPIKEAEALAWGGLNEDFYGNPITSTWINLKNVSPTLANQIQVINSNYANGSDGTACP